jgi:hypothetical protein
MGRTATADAARVCGHVTALYGRKSWEAGLLVGRLGSKERDHVLFVAATPADPQRPEASQGQ